MNSQQIDNLIDRQICMGLLNNINEPLKKWKLNGVCIFLSINYYKDAIKQDQKKLSRSIKPFKKTFTYTITKPVDKINHCPVIFIY